MLSPSDVADLRLARSLLEDPGLAIKIASSVGKPVEWALRRLPGRAHRLVLSATRRAMEAGLAVALWTLDTGPSSLAQKKPRARNRWHRLAVMATGGAGGFFGLAGLPLELPISTVIMLRSIADQARAQGEDLSGQAEARVSCLMVFALGGKASSDDAAETSYFAVRAALARTVAEAVAYFAERAAAEALADEGAPALARLVASLATRFAPAVADKIAAQLVPAIGAVGGAAINALFIKHFQDVALGHFTVRRLERKYGADVIRAAYEESR